MKVYYIISNKGSVGCMNLNKLQKMYRAYNIFICDISEFTGQLLSQDWVD